MPSRRYEMGLRQVAAGLVSLREPSPAMLEQLNSDLRSIRLDATQMQKTDLIEAATGAEAAAQALIRGEANARLRCVREVHRLGQRLLLGLQEVAEKPEEQVDSRPEGEKKILVVDDSRVAAFALANSFLAHKFAVHSVATMAEALAELDDFSPSVLVSDVFMPNIDLKLLCRSFRERHQHRHGLIVLVSGSSGETVEALLASIKPDAFVPKMAGTGAVVARVVELWQKQQTAAPASG